MSLREHSGREMNLYKGEENQGILLRADDAHTKITKEEFSRMQEVEESSKETEN